MGIYLSVPSTEKDLDASNNQRMAYGAGDMQGCSFLIPPFLLDGI